MFTSRQKVDLEFDIQKLSRNLFEIVSCHCAVTIGI